MTKSIILILTVVLLAGCAMSMTPSEFIDKFPESTESNFYNVADADIALSTGECRLLVTGRNYSAPIALTVDGDLNNGASGVDEWVQIDGGNAYRLLNFEWIDVWDATQLIVYFDTMICEKVEPRQLGA
jgi:hypothetical protein